MPRFDVTTFGEGGLRLSVHTGKRLATASQFDVQVAGAEGNVVGALSHLGWRSGWVSSLLDTPAGQRIAHEYRSAGVDLSSVVWRDEGRVSVYYVEYSVPPRPTKVYFDRKNSCVNQLTIEDINWDYILDARVIHLTGITVPLSENCQAIILEILQRAKQQGVTISFDVNYRNLLWSPTEARKILEQILPMVDILFCSRSDAHTIFGFSGEYKEILNQLVKQTESANVVMSVSHDGVLGWDGQNVHHIPAKHVGIIDRIGAGDGLVAGVLHGWLQNDFIKGLEYGVIMSALAMSQFGDMIITTAPELETLLTSPSLDIDR